MPNCSKCLWLGMYCIARECHYEEKGNKELKVSESKKVGKRRNSNKTKK
jgi:hypothetical protein